MLEQLLVLIRRGGVHTMDSLARQLNVTPALVEMMLADLESRGLIMQAGTCGDNCDGCELVGKCGQRGVQKLWTVRL